MPTSQKTSAYLCATIAATFVINAQAISIDGTLDAGYGSALAVQTVNTGFGDSTIGDGTSFGGSELDAAYGSISGGYLYLFLAGNFQNNGNHLNVFLSDGRAGQSTLAAAGGTAANMNGSVFSSGFQATYMLDLNDYANTVYVEEHNLFGTPTGGYVGSFSLSGGIGGGTPGGSIQYALNNLNVGGVNGSTGTAANAATAQAVTTGMEIAIPLSLLGSPTSVSVLASINGGGDGYLSNQFLTGLGVGSGNVASSQFNFGSTPGQFFTVTTVPEPSSLMLGASGLLTLLALRRRK